jgi:peptidoglycan/LPS O-acetylase OafA/YrhL
MPYVPAKGTIPRLAVLDGLRGIAMLLIVLAHLWPGWLQPAPVIIILRGASLALTLFFFISGFGIFYLFARSAFDGGAEQSVRDFIIRRMGKILPSYYLCIFIVVMLGWTNRDPGLAPLGTQLLTHVFFVHNLFPHTLYGIAGVMWSLAVECQFYLLFGLTRTVAIRWPVAYTTTLVAIAIAYRAWARSVAPGGNDYLDDQLPAMLDTFGLGMLCAYVYRYIDKQRPQLASRHVLWTRTAIAIVVCIYADTYVNAAMTERAATWIPVVVKPVLGTIDAALFAVLTLASLFSVAGWRRILGNRAFVFIGAISYNVYLYHQVVFLQLWQRWGGNVGKPLHAVLSGLALTMTIVFAFLLKRYYEQPILNYLRRFETGRSARVPPPAIDSRPIPLLSGLVAVRPPDEA